VSWDEAHEAYINHLVRCSSCSAQTVRYCDQGIALRVEYLADYLFSLDAREDRRAIMRIEKERNPKMYPQLDALVRARLEKEQ
jgi:hypothetical protein